MSYQHELACKSIIEKHGKEFIDLIKKHVSAHQICAQFGLCSSRIDSTPLGLHPCTYGPSYWCQNERNADECNARTHCEARVWFAPKTSNPKLVGADHCTRGPGYWCQNEETAIECGVEAKEFCEALWNQHKSKRSLGEDNYSKFVKEARPGASMAMNNPPLQPGKKKFQ